MLLATTQHPRPYRGTARLLGDLARSGRPYTRTLSNRKGHIGEKTEFQRIDDMNCLIKLIQKECLCEEVGKRCHEAFPKLYLGKQVRTHHGLGHDEVMTLTEPIYHSCRHVYFDNFFTGLPLLNSLLDVSLYGCGTVRINIIVFPKELSKSKDIKNQGDTKTLQQGQITASVGRDKKNIHHLSALSDPTDMHQAT